MAVCEKCGSENVSFRREDLGSTRTSQGTSTTSRSRVAPRSRTNSSRSSQTVHEYRTVGFCKNCGYTWEPDFTPPKPEGKRTDPKLVLGIIFSAVGLLGFTQLGKSEDIGAYIMGIIMFLAAGAILLFLHFKQEKEQKSAEEWHTVEPSQTYKQPVIDPVIVDYDNRGLPIVPHEITATVYNSSLPYSDLRNRLRILIESYKIVVQTQDISTFCTRYELVIENATALDQAYIENRDNIKALNCQAFCKAVLDNTSKIKSCFLTTYDSAAFSSLEQLKTNNGKLERCRKMLENVTSGSNIFSDVQEYSTLIDKISDYMATLAE